MPRTVIHVDLNSFYASVECLYNPTIRNLPVSVGGKQEDRHGIILASNQIAKGFKIKTGEPIWQAKQKCGNLVVVPPNFPLYLRFSKDAREIYKCYTDKVESYGIDENWLDLTDSVGIFGSGEKVAEEIRQRIKRELGLTVSIGVSWNKIFAKLGSDYKKPDAITVINQDNYKDIAWKLPANDLLYVGRSTYKKLMSRGINTIGDIANIGHPYLKRMLGKWGEVLWIFAMGLDDAPVANIGYESVIKSIGNSFTTPADLENNNDVKNALYVLSESVAHRLRENHFKCKTVQIYIRDNKLQSCQHQGKLELPSFLCSEIAQKVFELFLVNYKWGNNIRSVGVRACDLVSADTVTQLSFFVDMEKRLKTEQLEICIDDIRRRYGNFSVQRASLIGDKKSGTEDPETHIIHPVSYF